MFLLIQNNSTVVHYQLPTQVTLHDVNIDINSSPDSEYVYASGSRRFAMSLTYMCAGILFLWSIPFAVIAWILAIAVSFQLEGGGEGDQNICGLDCCGSEPGYRTRCIIYHSKCCSNTILWYLSCKHACGIEVIITVHMAPTRNLLFTPW